MAVATTQAPSLAPTSTKERVRWQSFFVGEALAVLEGARMMKALAGEVSPSALSGTPRSLRQDGAATECFSNACRR
jgi:hypothetical protein